MCGIVGFFDGGNKLEREQSHQRLSSELATMALALEHRGQDGQGLYVSPSQQCYLGHRRLSILDRTHASDQPMQSADGRYVITFNGEIYNYKELAVELKKEGVVFITSGDTEVLLYAYIRWGIAALNKLRGMFAFAIFDNQTKKLFLARDQLGIKPLYWFFNQIEGIKLFGFASEIKAILATQQSQKKINRQALAHYLQYHFVKAPLTMVEDIFALEPGHYIELDTQSFKIQKYWDIATFATDVVVNEPQMLVQKVRMALHDSVSLHLRSDIPVGAFLSGGLDSSALVALATEQTSIPLKTFSVGFGKEGAYLDETELALMVAKKYGCDHQKLVIDGKFLRNNFDAFIGSIDQPSGDGLNSYLVSRAAGAEVRVALSGLGGDELFLGYRYFHDLAKMQSWQESLVKRMFLPALSYGYKQSSLMRGLAYKNNMDFLKFWPARQDSFYLKNRSLFSAEEVHRLLPRVLRYEGASLTHDQLLETMFMQEKDFLNGFSKAELSWYTPGVLLRDADATGMASTLEVRFPFLDIPLLKLMLSIPGSYKVQADQKTNKPLLVAALGNRLPQELVQAPKRGFEMPVGYWLVNNFTRELRSLPTTPWLSTETVNRLLEQFYKNPKSYMKVWSLMVLKQWITHHQLEMPYV